MCNWTIVDFRDGRASGMRAVSTVDINCRSSHTSHRRADTSRHSQGNANKCLVLTICALSTCKRLNGMTLRTGALLRTVSILGAWYLNVLAHLLMESCLLYCLLLRLVEVLPHTVRANSKKRFVPQVVKLRARPCCPLYTLPNAFFVFALPHAQTVWSSVLVDVTLDTKKIWPTILIPFSGPGTKFSTYE